MASTAAWSAASFSPRPIQRAARQRGGFRHAHELEREVAIRRVSPALTARGPYIRSGASTPTRSSERAITARVARHSASRNGCHSRSRARGGGGRSGGSRRRRGSRRSGSPAARAARPPRRRRRGSRARRLTRSRSSRRERRPAARADTSCVARVAHDPGDARVRVLDVVDGVLLRLLGGEVDVDLDRLVGAAVDEVPARRVDADLVDEVVEEDDVAAPLRHLRLLAAAGQVDELVEQHLDARGVVAEHPGDRRVPVARAVVVGAEHVDRAVEPALELVTR